MRRLYLVFPVLLFSGLLSGCFRADIDASFFEDGAGQVVVKLSSHREKLPPFIKDPLAGVGTPADLKRHSGPGIVAWAPTRREDIGGWDVITMTAFFDDINAVRFHRRRGEEIAKVLDFDYAPQEKPGHLEMLVDLGPELAEPLPIPEREGGMAMSPDMLRTVMTMFRPMLKEMALELRVHVPGELVSASGFTDIDGSVASVLADRDAVLAALTERAGAMVDVKALLAEDAAIVWTPAGEDKSARKKYESDRNAAHAWWAKQFSDSR